MFQRRAIRRNVNRTATDIHGLLNANVKRYFKQKPLLRIYREAAWMPDLIPDESIQVVSGMGGIRLAQTKTLVDPETGNRRLEDTPIAIRARAIGIEDEISIQLAAILREEKSNKKISDELRASITAGYKNSNKFNGECGPGQVVYPQVT